MALRDALQLVKDTRKDLLATSSGVRRAKEAYATLLDEIKSAKGKLTYKKSTRHADVHARNVLKALKAEKELRAILIAEIDDAVARSGKEFEENDELYKEMLYEVADNPDVYLMVPLGAGWATTISPQIIFEHAGTLHDYATGIEEFRISKNVKVGAEGTGRGLKATSWWRKNVYGTSRYDSTIRARVSFSGRPAPFWSLIAHGSVALASDRPDGSYNPYPSRGVNFVQNAEDAVKVRFLSLMKAEQEKWLAETKEFEKEIDKAERIRQDFEEGIDDLTIEYSKNRETIRKFGEDAKYVDEDRLAIAARRLRADESLEQKTITLSAPGSPKTVRTRVRTLEGRLEY